MVFAGLMTTQQIFNYRKTEISCRFSSNIYFNDLAKLEGNCWREPRNLSINSAHSEVEAFCRQC